MDLSNEILEHVFSYLPIQDLLCGAASVCRRWHSIASAPGFLFHKKRYFRYRTETNPVLGGPLYLEKTSLQAHMTSELDVDLATENIAVPIIDIARRILKEIRRSERRRDLFGNIIHHSQYQTVLAVLRQSPTLKQFVDDPCCLTTVICLMANEIHSVREIFYVMALPDNILCSYKDVSELLYEVATYLLIYEQRYKSPMRLHFQVYHALYLSENNWTYDPSMLGAFGDSPTDQQKVELTPEQKRLVYHDFNLDNHGVIRVLAYAGSGKTTVLLQLTKKNPKLKFLLVVFNKMVQLKASTSFPPNVTCRTAHSLAYAHLIESGIPRRRLGSTISAGDVLSANLYGSRGTGSGNVLTRAAQVLDTLERYCHSEHKEISMSHVPEEWFNGQENKTLCPIHRATVFDDARQFWEEGVANRGHSLRISGSMYLKLFQLMEPNLKSKRNFDVILIDEGQDMNPAILDICLRQSCPKVIVGDPHQQIYAFNGAINALENVHKWSPVIATYRLSQSFRFGPEVAYVASATVHQLKKEQHYVMSSGKVKDRLEIRKPGPECLTPVAIIGRSNARLFEEMVELVCLPIEEMRPRILNLSSDNFDKLVDLGNLRTKNFHLIKDKYVKSFKDFEDFKSVVSASQDVSGLVACAIVDRYREKVESFVQIIRNQSLPRDVSMTDPRIRYIFSTVHKFKGLEFPSVYLLDDFFIGNLPLSGETPGVNCKEEINLLYVALTRAQHSLILNDSLILLLFGLAKENFEHYVPLESIPSSEKCAVCRRLLSTVRTDQHVFIKNFILGLYFCPNCSNFGMRMLPWKCTKRKSPELWPNVLRWHINPRAYVLGSLVPRNVSGDPALNEYGDFMMSYDMHASRQEDIFPDDDFEALVQNL